MAKSLNKVMLIGNLGADPEIKTTQTGMKVANLSIATNERWTDKAGATQEHTEWHRGVIYGSLADVAERYLKKGQRVYVEGSIRTNKWDDRDGNTRYTTEVRVRDLILLDGRGDGGGNMTTDEPRHTNTRGASAMPVDAELSDDDIPF